MKPQTIETITALCVEDIKKETTELLVNLDGKADSSELLDLAVNCRNIADVAEALENMLMTAADEAGLIEAAAIAQNDSWHDGYCGERLTVEEFVDRHPGQ